MFGPYNTKFSCQIIGPALSQSCPHSKKDSIHGTHQSKVTNDSDIFVRKHQHVLNRLNDYESSITPTKRQEQGKSQLHNYYTIIRFQF